MHRSGRGHGRQVTASRYAIGKIIAGHAVCPWYFCSAGSSPSLSASSRASGWQAAGLLRCAPARVGGGSSSRHSGSRPPTWSFTRKFPIQNMTPKSRQIRTSARSPRDNAHRAPAGARTGCSPGPAGAWRKNLSQDEFGVTAGTKRPLLCKRSGYGRNSMSRHNPASSRRSPLVARSGKATDPSK
jgi:hypothetical protein